MNEQGAAVTDANGRTVGPIPGLQRANAAGRRLALAVFGLCLWALPAAAATRHAAMLVDANTGQVLHAEAADAPRYPASLTKVMTLYIVFEQIELGRLSPETRIRISPQAASVAPSKLGLEPGSTITVSDAAKALITKSANDVAVALAEHIAGDETRFAEAMTRKARELGMKATTFRNAHGLPDREQVTTARDMLTLALRLYDKFPDRARLFALRTFQYAGRTHRNHNTMLANFAGMDGIKTGYTAASGFNLLASVRRDGRHVLAIVMGGSSAAARNARMRLVLNRGLPLASEERTRRPLVVASRPLASPARTENPAPLERTAQIVSPRRVATIPVVPPPRLVEPVAAVRPEVPRTSGAPAGSWSPQVRLAAPAGAETSVAGQLAARGWQPSIASETRGVRPPSTLAAQAAYLGNRSVGSGPVPDTRPVAGAGIQAGAAIQVGAFGDPREARERLEEIRRLSPRLLSGASAATPAINANGRTLYRARFVGLDSGTATAACTQLRRQQVDCLVTRSE